MEGEWQEGFDQALLLEQRKAEDEASLVVDKLGTLLPDELKRGLPAGLRKDLVKSPMRLKALMVGGREGRVDEEVRVADNEIGLIFIPGATDDVERLPHIGKALVEGVKAQTGEADVLALLVSSSASINTSRGRVDRDPVVRAAHVVMFLLELLEKQTCEEVVLLGHSLGGQELALVAPLLNACLEEKYGDERGVAGVIFFQSGGLYEQGLGHFVKEFFKSQEFREEIEELLPSPLDERRYEDELREARAGEDQAEVLRLERRLGRVQRVRKGNFAKLRSNMGELEVGKRTLNDVLDEVMAVDKMIQYLMRFDWDESKLGKCLDKRFKLLQPVIRGLILQDLKEMPKMLDEIKASVLSLKLAFSKHHKLWNFMPQWMRNLYEMPVVIAAGEKDLNFPSDKVEAGIQAKTHEARGKLFKGQVILAKLGSRWAHLTPHLREEEFGKTVGNMIWRIRGFKQGNKETAEKRLRLNY